MKAKQSIISIVLPTYNGIRYIREAIDSCLSQTYRNIELIIVDDGSTVDINSIIKGFVDSRILFIKNKENLGLAEALNIGFSKAKGDYFTWISDDNLYKKEALEVMLNFLIRYPYFDFVYSHYYLIDENGNLIGFRKVKSPKSLNIGNYIGPSFLYKREIFEKIGGYSSDYKLAEDYEYWLRIRKHFNMKKINRFLYYYRVHGQSLTAISRKPQIIVQTLKASWNYIPNWARYYQKGLVFFSFCQYKRALKMFLISILLNPFNIYCHKKIIQIFFKIIFKNEKKYFYQ